MKSLPSTQQTALTTLDEATLAEVTGGADGDELREFLERYFSELARRRDIEQGPLPF